MKRQNPYIAYQQPQVRRFIGPVRSTAMLNRQIARQRLAARGFKPGYSRKAGFYGRYGQTAARLGNVPEKKFHDVGLAFDIDFTAETAAAAGTGQLDLIAQGDTESTRDGRQCTIDSIEIKGTLTFTPGAGATASGMTAIYLIQDTQANGAQATFSDIFTTTVVNTCVHNLANSNRFKVLKKWIHTWNPPAGATTAFNTQTKFFDSFKKCNIPLEFSAATGAITELKSNHVFLAYGATLSGIDDLVSFAGKSRIRFRG